MNRLSEEDAYINENIDEQIKIDMNRENSMYIRRLTQKEWVKDKKYI